MQAQAEARRASATEGVASLSLVFLSTAVNWTGGERCLVTVARGLARRGHRVAFAYHPEGAIGGRLGTEVEAVPLAIRNDAGIPGAGALRRLIRERAADIVCVNKVREVRVGGLAARLARRARVVNRIGLSDGLSDDLSTRLTYPWLVDAIIRDSDAGCRAIRSKSAWFRGAVLRARNGVDAAALARIAPAARASFGAAANEIVIAAVGRVGPVKGSTELARAVVALAAWEPARKLRLVFIGEARPNRVAELQRLLEPARASVAASFTGALPPDQTLRILAACDILARPSRDDGISFTVLEAMALGLPVVASAVGGLVELVVDGVTGRLVPPGDVHALSEALAPLVCDAQLRRALGEAGRVRVATEFSESQMIDEYEAAFRQVVRGAVAEVRT